MNESLKIQCFYSFTPKSVDNLIRNLVATNKASRSEADEIQDFFQSLLQMQKKYSENISSMNLYDHKFFQHISFLMF